MTVYIAGPMRGYSDHNRAAFTAAAARLRAAGLAVANPHELALLYPRIDEGDFRAWMAIDIKRLVDCDEIYLLDGWERSEGARLEFTIAVALGLVVTFEYCCCGAINP